MGAIILKHSRNLLLSAAMVLTRLEKSTRLLNDLKNHGNQIFIFSDEKTFTVDLVFNKQNDQVVIFGNDVSKHRRASTTKCPDSSLNHDVWHRSIDLGGDASGLV